MTSLLSALFGRQSGSKSRRGVADDAASHSEPNLIGSRAPRLVSHRVLNKKGTAHETFELYDYYKPVAIVGEGAYASVLKAVDTRTNTTVAIKKNKDVFVRLEDSRRILREVKLYRHFAHPNVMQVLDVIVPASGHEASFNEVYIVMPYYKATLHDIAYRARQSLSETHLQWMTYQLLHGLACMHAAGVQHRDLKPENVLVEPKGSTVRISDFGLAKGETSDMTEYVVTRPYRAPEVVANRTYDNRVDVWSVGCILGELLEGKRVFSAGHQLDLLGDIVRKLGRPGDFDWVARRDVRTWIRHRLPRPGPTGIAGLFPHASPSCQDLLARLLAVDPRLRPTAAEALRHPWLQGMERRMARLLRNTAADAGAPAPVFDVQFELDRKLKTKFGARAMMMDELRRCRLAMAMAAPSRSPSPLPSLRGATPRPDSSRDDDDSSEDGVDAVGDGGSEARGAGAAERALRRQVVARKMRAASRSRRSSSF